MQGLINTYTLVRGFRITETFEVFRENIDISLFMFCAPRHTNINSVYLSQIGSCRPIQTRVYRL